MEEKQVKIRTGKDDEGHAKVVATITVPVYQTIDELIEKEKANVILAKFNSQNITDLCNAERAKHKPTTMGKAAKRQALLNVCTTEEVVAALQEPGDDNAAKLDALVNSDLIQQRLKEKLGGE